MEEDNKVLLVIQTILNKICYITFAIKQLYNDLFLLEIHKDENIDYNDELNTLLEKLVSLKIEEKVIYKELESDFALLIKIINYCDKYKKTNLTEEEYLCFKRIKRNLQIIFYSYPLEEVAIGCDYFSKDYKHKFLTSEGLSEIEAITFYRKFKNWYDKSSSYRFITYANEEIKKAETKSQRINASKIKLDYAFLFGNEVEDDLVLSRFTTVTNTLFKEISYNFDIDYELKSWYLSMENIDSIYTVLERLQDSTPCNKTAEDIIRFKVFLLYLGNEQIATIKYAIIQIKFKSQDVKNELISAIMNIDKLRLLHDSDSDKKEF